MLYYDTLKCSVVSWVQFLMIQDVEAAGPAEAGSSPRYNLSFFNFRSYMHSTTIIAITNNNLIGVGYKLSSGVYVNQNRLRKLRQFSKSLR